MQKTWEQVTVAVAVTCHVLRMNLTDEPQDYAVLLWNHDSHKVMPYGATQREAA